MPPAPPIRFGFKLRVLAPVVGIMGLLFAGTLWIINERLTRQVREQAAASLRVTATVFENFQDLRGQDLLLRARNIQSDPRLKAVAQVNDAKTMSVLLRDLAEELNLGFAAYYGGDGHPRARAGLSAETGSAAVDRVAAVAVEGGTPVDTAVVDGRLMTLAAMPILAGESVAGAIVIGQEIGAKAAGDFRTLTDCETVLFDGDRIIATSFRDEAALDELRRAMSTRGEPPDLIMGRQHMLVRRGFLGPPDAPRCRYALLASFEPALRDLRQTQLMLALLGTFGLGVGVLVIRFILTRAAAPLDCLQEGAERIGRGDFSQRVEVTSHDEFGKLAVAFNEMTDNLKVSREKLEATVRTLKDTQARLIQSEKLSAVGEFISGVAHELNNPLTVMIGYAQLLANADIDRAHKDDIAQISDAAERCHKIVQNLLSFARQRPPERKRVNLNEVVDATARFMSYELRTGNITVERDLDPNLPPVMADAHQLQQVFLNLINNARQALEESGRKGRLRLASRVAGPWVRIVIADDGPGIPADFLARIFDPFFTTKPAGKGTGLGLSVSYGIVKEHGGDIRVESEPGAGATFTLDFPCAIAEADAKSAPVAIPAEVGDGEKRRVLVVDDEASVLALAQRFLVRLGYAVSTANNGDESLVLLREQRFDAILCDWKMPGLSGRELFERIRALQPGLEHHFVLVSGDVFNDHLLNYSREQNFVLLAKPFTLEQLREAIAAVIATG